MTAGSPFDFPGTSTERESPPVSKCFSAQSRSTSLLTQFADKLAELRAIAKEVQAADLEVTIRGKKKGRSTKVAFSHWDEMEVDMKPRTPTILKIKVR